jgi:Fe-S-cluster containining protein
MTGPKVRQPRELPAGDFSSWMIEIQGAIRAEHGSDVPCGTCTACCKSSQFILIEPDEIATLANIPKELLFLAPRMPRGHVLLGYDEHGHCPMLIDNQCSIYEHRPKTCRTYDCRIFPSTGVEINEEDKSLIAHQVRRWKFNLPTASDKIQQEAVQASATYLDEHKGLLPHEVAPMTPTELAILAIEIHDVFLQRDENTGHTAVVVPDPGLVRDAVLRRKG